MESESRAGLCICSRSRFCRTSANNALALCGLDDFLFDFYTILWLDFGGEGQTPAPLGRMRVKADHILGPRDKPLACFPHRQAMSDHAERSLLENR